jgi:hypothetical protein
MLINKLGGKPFVEKIKCSNCGTAIVIQDGQETLIKSRLIRIAGNIKQAKCTKCKNFTEVQI